MKKIIYSLTFLIALGISNQALAQEPPAKKTEKSHRWRLFKKKKEPKVEVPPAPPAEPFAEFSFEKETHDFGNVPNGPDVMYEFKFKNIGNSPLIISGVTAPCGCTAPEAPKDPIAPGATAGIKVVYHTQGRIGGISKAVTIISNSKSQPTKLIYITGNVNQ
ncbi:MAG: DUF1573 domain-containing protein [Bacteroidota bacterium]|nr:DUF1573 domain-containing protein [Bacteroidota bacterium]